MEELRKARLEELKARSGGFRFERLTPEHDRAAFSCESPPLTRFLRERALRDMRSRISVTHVLVSVAEVRTVIGYHTLAAASVLFHRIPEQDIKRARLSRYPALSATLIARLARDARWRGHGIGDLLMVDALRRAYEQTFQVGAAYVIVDAIDVAAAGFYESHGFLRFADDPGQLFLEIASLARLYPK